MAKRMTMSLVRIALLCAVSLLAPAHASAQAPYPSQTVKIIDPFSAGSISDILARVVADKLAEMWHQTVIVENRPGIAGTVSVGKSAPDGYTLMVTSNGHTILGALNKNLSVDPVKDYAGVSEIATVPLVLIVTPSLPATNLQELIALAKAKPGTLNFTSAGLASSSYIATESFKQAAKIDIVHVPYKGTLEQLTSLMRGDAQMSLAFLGTAVSFIQTGKVRALAMATPKRVASLPNIPTFAESGLPDYHYDSWFGMLAPANTPVPILKKISDDVAAILKMPDVQAHWETLGAIPVSNTPEQFDAIIRSDTERYGKLLRDAGVMPQ
jgi:tripartite-type tricarboxylate transporter receptor subunit TctC